MEMNTKRIDNWRIEAEYRALSSKSVSMAFKRISKRYHELLHRIKEREIR